MELKAHDADESVEVLAPVEAVPSLSDRVYHTLKQYIVNQRLRPGSKLSVPRLAQQLAVSRTPVKEAIERLGQEGLVTMLPNRGAFVAIIREEDVREIYQMREMLEGLAARLAAPTMDPHLIGQLRALLNQGETAVRGADIDAHIKIDLEFHRLIRERAGNRRLVRALDNLQDQIRMVFRTPATIPGRMVKALDEHRRLLDALETGQPDKAEQAARDHIRRIREAVLLYLQNQELTDVSNKAERR